MLKPRLIPALLLDHQLHLVKTTRFGDRHYLGDPLNAAYVFSSYEVDELMVLDIDATPARRSIPFPFVAALARFTTVPLTVGGGIHSLEQIQALVALGVEKVALSSVLDHDFAFLAQATHHFGSSTITVVLNVLSRAHEPPMAQFGRDGEIKPLAALAQACEQAGAGELVIHHRGLEGTRSGYAIPLLAELNDRLTIPLVALGGCLNHQHIDALLTATPLSGVAVGSMFVYSPGTREVLLNYCDTHDWLGSQLPRLQGIAP